MISAHTKNDHGLNLSIPGLAERVHMHVLELVPVSTTIWSSTAGAGARNERKPVDDVSSASASSVKLIEDAEDIRAASLAYNSEWSSAKNDDVRIPLRSERTITTGEVSATDKSAKSIITVSANRRRLQLKAVIAKAIEKAAAVANHRAAIVAKIAAAARRVQAELSKGAHADKLIG